MLGKLWHRHILLLQSARAQQDLPGLDVACRFRGHQLLHHKQKPAREDLEEFGR